MSKLVQSKLAIALGFALMTGLANPANAVVNGEQAVGSKYAVALVNRYAPESSLCSGAYLRPQVVVTAAHCVIKNGGRAGEYSTPLGNLYVSQAGADLSSAESKKSIVKVLKIWTSPTYFARWEPEKGLMETQVDDIAFLFLEKELDGPHVDRAASKEELTQYRSGSFSGYHIGYGCLGKKDNQIISNKGLPYRAGGMTASNRVSSHIPDLDRYLNTNSLPGQSICPGDSGSPLLADINGETVYIATIFAGGGWDRLLNGQPNIRGDATATVLWPYIPFLDQAWVEFQKEIRELEAVSNLARAAEAKKIAQQKIAKSRARKAGTLYVSPGCHAVGINAELQILKSGRWQRLAGAKVWETVKNCPASNPVAPWTTAKPPAKAKLRWRYWVVGGWDVTSDVFLANKTR